ncbi:MAG: hypothetical protein ACJ74W_16635 [Pyrinomonadaceae bacterium]
MVRAKSARAKQEQPQTPMTARGIVNPNALDKLKRRAEDLGLIVHARATAMGPARKNQDRRKK